eukprot:scaffold66075_cov62-Phaeocystis_antarctica.AAC.3
MSLLITINLSIYPPSSNRVVLRVYIVIIPPMWSAAGLPDCVDSTRQQPDYQTARSSTMRSQHERAVLTAAVLTVLTAQYRLASWTWSRKVPAEQAVIEAEVANGWHLRYNALPSTLAEAERSAFALVPDATYLTPDVPPDEWYHDWHGVVPGGAAWGASGDVRSPWAGLLPAWLSGGFAQRQTMSQAAPIASPSLGQSAAWAALAGRNFQPCFPARCAAWVARAEELQLETGDFVFAGGSWGLSRIHTGARRHSATRMVMDEGFAALMKTRLDGQVCPVYVSTLTFRVYTSLHQQPGWDSPISCFQRAR